MGNIFHFQEHRWCHRMFVFVSQNRNCDRFRPKMKLERIYTSMGHMCMAVFLKDRPFENSVEYQHRYPVSHKSISDSGTTNYLDVSICLRKSTMAITTSKKKTPHFFTCRDSRVTYPVWKILRNYRSASYHHWSWFIQNSANNSDIQ